MKVQLNNFPSIEHIKQLEKTNPPKSIRVWGRVIGLLYNETCIVTGLKKSEVAVEKHHIYNVYDFPQLKLSLFNGVTLTRELHLMLHRLYGQKVTVDDFLKFLKILKNTEHNTERLFLARLWIEQLKKELESNI